MVDRFPLPPFLFFSLFLSFPFHIIFIFFMFFTYFPFHDLVGWLAGVLERGCLLLLVSLCVLCVLST